MVIVPHEDDEINIAGSTICGAREEGMRVICVFVTNGDYKYIPDVRINEAIHALSVLGVSQEDVIFWDIRMADHTENILSFKR